MITIVPTGCEEEGATKPEKLTYMSTEPAAWLVIFNRLTPTWWVRWLTPGEFKHVSAVGYVHAAKAWLHVSWEMGRVRAEIIPDAGFETWLARHTAAHDSAVLRVRAPAFDIGPLRLRASFFCVGMIAHLLGLRGGALFPSGLWRTLVRNGAVEAFDAREARGDIQPQDPAVPADGDRRVRRGIGGTRAA